MTARRRGTSGRTTPKGTKSPKKRARKNESAELPEHGVPKIPPPKQVAKSQKWVKRPTSHNRGNR